MGLCRRCSDGIFGERSNLFLGFFGTECETKGGACGEELEQWTRSALRLNFGVKMQGLRIYVRRWAS